MGFHTENRDFTQFFILDQSEKRLWQLGLAADVLREAVSSSLRLPSFPHSSPLLRAKLSLCSAVADVQLPDLQKRVQGTTTSATNAKADEERRIAAAKRQIEADRELVKQRVERERIVREAREAARKQAEAEPQPQEEPHFRVRGQGHKLDDTAGTTGTTGTGEAQPSGGSQQSVGPSDDADMIPSDNDEDEAEDEDGDGAEDGEETDEDERAFRRQDAENRMGMFGMASNAHHWGGGNKLGE